MFLVILKVERILWQLTEYREKRASPNSDVLYLFFSVNQWGWLNLLHMRKCGLSCSMALATLLTTNIIVFFPWSNILMSELKTSLSQIWQSTLVSYMVEVDQKELEPHLPFQRYGRAPFWLVLAAQGWPRYCRPWANIWILQHMLGPFRIQYMTPICVCNA